MKKFLLSLSLLGAVLFGNAQVLLNELYTDPSPAKGQAPANHEFFELYNAGIDETSTSLDCYSIVSYFNNGGVKGFYVIDLPNLSISSKSYFVGAAANPFNVQKKRNVAAAFNWNSSTLSSIGGSFKKYTANPVGSPTPYTITTPTATEGQNFFSRNGSGVASNPDYAVFLFKNGDYVNGFLGKYSSSAVPDDITKMPAITGLSNPCGTYSLDFSKVKSAEFVGKADGTDNGYIRYGDGLCGLWDKANSEHTPNLPNPLGTTTSTSGTITATESILCGGTKVYYKVSSVSDAGTFPITIELYYDRGTLGTLDVGDTKEASFIINNEADLGTYSFDIPSGQEVLIVYRTSLGCISEIADPQIGTGSLTTSERNVCDSRIDFSINSTSEAADFSLPITVKIYAAVGGTIPADAQPIATKTYTSFTNGAINDNFTLATPNSNVIVVYETSNCYTLPQRLASPVAGDITTFERNYCGKSIEFGVQTATGDLATPTYGSVVATLYEDVNNNNTYEAGIDIAVAGLAPQNITVGTTYTYNIPAASQGKNYIIVYQPTAACLKETYEPIQTNNAVEVDPGGSISFEINGSNKRTASYQVLSSTNAAAYPLTLKVYEDADNDGEIEDGQLAAGTQTITSPTSADNHVYTVEIGAKSGIIVTAESIYGCSFDALAIDAQESVLPVTYASFTATRSNNNQVVLEWETAMEENNRGFHVQRNTDGNWKNIGFVFTQADNGNSSAQLKYAFKDANNSKGITQYRILQVDIDGKGKYSEVRAVRGLETAARVTLFPNPSHTGSFSLLFEDGTSVRDVMVSDVSGRVVKQYKSVNGNTLTVNGLIDGFYTVQVANRSNGSISVEKVIIKKR